MRNDTADRHYLGTRLDYFTPTPEEQTEGVDLIVRGVVRPRPR